MKHIHCHLLQLMWTWFQFFWNLVWSFPFIPGELRFELPHDKTNKVFVHPAMTVISLGIHPVWSRVFTVRMMTAWVLSLPLSAQRRLIRLGQADPGWSESSLGTYAISLVLSWGGSFSITPEWCFLRYINKMLLFQYKWNFTRELTFRFITKEQHEMYIYEFFM